LGRKRTLLGGGAVDGACKFLSLSQKMCDSKCFDFVVRVFIVVKTNPVVGYVCSFVIA